MNERRGRKSIRLPGYDYSQAGAYFITIVTQDRVNRFGEIRNHQMMLNSAGEMIRTQWEAIPARFQTVELDEFVIMPNHFHAVIFLVALVAAASNMAAQTGMAAASNMAAPSAAGDTIRAGTSPAPTNPNPSDRDPTIAAIMGAFKSITTHEYIIGVDDHEWPRYDRRLWQRNYYEHIIRDPAALDKIRAYIRHNPLLWAEDRKNPAFKT